MSGLGVKAVQGIAAGIGLVSESISARKAKKQNNTVLGDEHDDRNSREGGFELPMSELRGDENALAPKDLPDSLERQWALDEAQEEILHSSSCEQLNPPPCSTQSNETVDEASLAHRFAFTYPASPPYTLHDHATMSPPRLSLPVVLPQRRPKTRDRGFIRAYAPVLADCGIDQAMFIDFLNTAEKASQAAPWLAAINLASIGTMWLPSVTGIAVSIAIQIATDVAIAADGRRKANSFFDKINREFFQPRGLYCLVMTWNPELPDCPATDINLDSLITSAASGGGSDLFGRLRHKFKSSDGKAYGNIFPEVAPLVFPQIDQLATDQDGQKKLAKMKASKEFVSTYMDKRAQAKFIARNPDSHLNQIPTPTFTSRYADPNHPASSGDPIALVTGGHLTVEKLHSLRVGQSNVRDSRVRGGRASYRMQDGRYRYQDPNVNPPAPHGRPFGLRDVRDTVLEIRNSRSTSQTGSRDRHESNYVDREGDRLSLRRDSQKNIGPLTPIAKLLKKKVLYLAIVNMPSEEEMSRAHELVREAS